MRIGEAVDLRRCPHCAVAAPNFAQVWGSQQPTPRRDGQQPSVWAAYACTMCGSVVSVKGQPGAREGNATVVAFYPEPKIAHEDLPEPARTFLQQAYETLHAPDAAAVMAGSAVDSMLKALGYEKGSLYDRIDLARGGGVLTQAMADWAHEVRLGSNRPRHADQERPHVSVHEASQSVEFAEALANFLFVLNARITRGIANARKDA